MSNSYSESYSQTFTLTHAKHLASKMVADLKRMQRFYNYPTDSQIATYEAELTEFLKAGYLSEVTYGFKRDGNWIEPTLRYTARSLAGLSALDDDPGRVRPNADVTGASFSSYMTYNDTYHQLSSAGRQQFENHLPFVRSGAPEPGINGYLSQDKTYSSGGQALDRSSIKSF